MNLYRSFGNLMEAWVAEQNPDPELLEDIPKEPPTPSSLSSSGLEKNVRTESVDSGVETASTDTFFPASSLSTDIAEMDSLASGVANDNYIPFSSGGPASLPPYLTPPAISHPTSLRRVQGSVLSNSKLRQALQRSESRRQSEPLGADQSDYTAPRHRTSKMRSESFGSWKTTRPDQISGMSKQTMASRSKMEPMQGSREVFSTDLSPGLRYLDQVCQIWEDVAKQQLANGGYHVDRDQVSSSCQSLDPPISFSSAKLENLSNKHKQLKVFSYGHFRQRSSSESIIPSTHSQKFGSRGQQMSTFNLLDKEAQDSKIQGDIAHRSNNKTWKIKSVSLKRDSLQNANNQVMQSLDRNNARRQLSQLFRKRRRTLPILT
ncbi:uncharacterized protein LOC144064041 [Vanacampus margaritifer]